MKLQIIILTLLIPFISHGKLLSEYSPYNYEVLFTNPECKNYEYKSTVLDSLGNTVKSKTKNAYCKVSDSSKSSARWNSPEKRLIDWIQDENTKEIFFSYLSFSNYRIKDALCSEIKKRGLKVRFILDSGTRKTVADSVVKCSNGNAKVFYRGQNSDLGYAHNKYFIINPNSKKDIKIAFSSGNLSSGTVLHHENWHFVTTSSESYFANVHLCMMNGTLDHAKSISSYKQYIANCRSKIKAEQEDDIKVYLVPGEGHLAMKQITRGIKTSDKISIAAHRFFNNTLIKNLKSKLSNSDAEVNIVVDDDLYWLGQLGGHTFGSNMRGELTRLKSLEKKGMNVRYIQTNHHQHLLHHNKFIIFEGNVDAVFTGAGNFTGAAFTKNFENFYYITIPEVVEVFKEQYKHLFHQLGTSAKQMPLTDIEL